MKQTEFTKSLDIAIQKSMKAIDTIVEELVEPLADVGQPEKLIGKKYEDWTPQDFQMLGKIYGQEPNPLSELIFTKTYERVKNLEQEVK